VRPRDPGAQRGELAERGGDDALATERWHHQDGDVTAAAVARRAGAHVCGGSPLTGPPTRPLAAPEARPETGPAAENTGAPRIHASAARRD